MTGRIDKGGLGRNRTVPPPLMKGKEKDFSISGVAEICYLAGIFEILKIIVIRIISGKDGNGPELNKLAR